MVFDKTIPNDPIIRSKWVEIIRKSRGEDYWKPAKSTVICSDHFHHKDLYYTKNQTGLRRLKKGVLPSKGLFVLPAKSEESASSGEEAEAISEGFSKQPTPSTSNQYEKKTTETDDQPIFPSTPKTSKVEQTEIEDFSDLDSVFDTPKKAKLRKQLRKKIALQKRYILKIQSLRRKNLRLKKKLASFKQILETLKTERYINDDTHDVLSSNVFAADLYAKMKKKIQGKSKKPASKYEPEFRKFCLTLHFLSPNAYRYIRNKFETCLPHPKTISKWYANIDGSPGLTDDAFKILEAKRKQSNAYMTCALIADEMAIRQQRCFNRQTKQDEGLVDMGTGPNEDLNVKASEAYAFMLNIEIGS
ncbi:uncharacterized protein LOC125490210 [Plutella xylostella]|uniref:uncharacterized protein LOC125490210 n=1 Tax=Plutella xylostella TaxID=51655 RepID=UPI00203289EB|nr:uncharacterized protein LOC125490210 [Plutella xylostella]